MGVKMRFLRQLVFILVTLYSTSGLSATADPITDIPDLNINSQLSDRWNFFLPKCYGLTDRIHKSSHVPGTVNVVTRTICPGQGVFISATLTRENDFVSISKSGSGNSKVQINLAMKCTWHKGMPLRSYLVSVTHRLADGAQGETIRRAKLNC